MKWPKCLVAGAPGADRGGGQIPETGGAPGAHAGKTPTHETGAGGLRADPGGFRLALMAGLRRRCLKNVSAAELLCCQHVLIWLV